METSKELAKRQTKGPLDVIGWLVALTCCAAAWAAILLLPPTPWDYALGICSNVMIAFSVFLWRKDVNQPEL